MQLKPRMLLPRVARSSKNRTANEINRFAVAPRALGLAGFHTAQKVRCARENFSSVVILAVWRPNIHSNRRRNAGCMAQKRPAFTRQATLSEWLPGRYEYEPISCELDKNLYWRRENTLTTSQERVGGIFFRPLFS